MAFSLPPARGSIKLVNILIDEYKLGVNKLVEEARLRPAEAVESINLMMVQDGVWKPRWGSDTYGAALEAVPDGAGEFIKTDGTRELIAIANGKFWKSTDGGSWTQVTGATFTAGTRTSMLQINSKLYVYNGVDDMALYDGSTLTTFSALSVPSGLALTRSSSMASGQYTLYYQVTALNDVGETVGGTEVSITVNKLRDSWTSTASDYVDLDWGNVTGATRYQIYMSTLSGYEVLLADSQVSAYRDDGTAQPNEFVEVPDDDTTSAPKFKSAWVSNNRLWGTYDLTNKYRVYYTGTGNFGFGRFSDFYGGGWIDLEPGGREEPRAGVHYQSGQGVGTSTVFCSTPEGRGSVWQVSIGSVTVGDDTFSVPSAFKIVGSRGTDSPFGVVTVENDVFFPNKDGAFSLGPEKNYYGLLRTNELTNRQRPYWRGISGNMINKIATFYYDAKVLFSVSTDGATNNRTIVYDRERLAWYVDWTIGFKQFLQYTDSDGNTHLLGVPESGTKLVELSADIQGDQGVAFRTSYLSGRIPINSRDWTKFAKIKKAFIKLGRPRGAINFSVLGTEKRRGYAQLASKTITSLFSLTGMGWDLMGSVQMGDTLGVPTAFAQATDIRFMKVNKRIRDIQFKVSSESTEADYTLLGLLAKGFELEISPPSSWKLTS